VLVKLVASEFAERVRSKGTGEWMYVFNPRFGGLRIYLKVILRADCVVISFHEERDENHEDESNGRYQGRSGKWCCQTMPVHSAEWR